MRIAKSEGGIGLRLVHSSALTLLDGQPLSAEGTNQLVSRVKMAAIARRDGLMTIQPLTLFGSALVAPIVDEVASTTAGLTGSFSGTSHLFMPSNTCHRQVDYSANAFPSSASNRSRMPKTS
jgi:hypothetical protein